MAIHLVLSSKSFTGIRFKAPRPPDHSTFRVTNNQAEVATLVVFNGDVLVRRHDDLSLPVGKWTGRQWDIVSVENRHLLISVIQQNAPLSEQGISGLSVSR